MAFAVMCCGCRRFLGPKGETVDILPPAGGLIPFTPIGPEFGAVQWLLAGDFPDKETADAVAVAAGWKVADERGSNHRCPDCLMPAPYAGMVEHRGAFVQFGNDQELWVDLDKGDGMTVFTPPALLAYRDSGTLGVNTFGSSSAAAAASHNALTASGKSSNGNGIT